MEKLSSTKPIREITCFIPVLINQVNNEPENSEMKISFKGLVLLLILILSLLAGSAKCPAIG